MNFFNDKRNNDLIKLLKKSEVDFSFDKDKVKAKLWLSLSRPQFKAHHHSFRLEVFKYSAIIAGLLIFLSATFAFASTSTPGDKLFALNKLGENVILDLPLSAEQNAKMYEHIVNKRLESLEAINVNSASQSPDEDAAETRALETAKESDESLSNAITVISANQAKLSAAGNTVAAANLDKVLLQLDDLATRHELLIEELKNSSHNAQIKQGLEKHLSEIRSIHAKFRPQSQKED